MGPLSRWLGDRAERRAARFLRRRGHLIIERNVHADPGEIDIVTIADGVVVFVEVRARREGLVAAIESITAKKRRTLAAAIRRYKTRERLWGVATRVDLVVVSGRDVEHVPGFLDETQSDGGGSGA